MAETVSLKLKLGATQKVRLNKALSFAMVKAGEESDDVLVEYIAEMIGNRRTVVDIVSALEDFIESEGTRQYLKRWLVPAIEYMNAESRAPPDDFPPSFCLFSFSS